MRKIERERERGRRLVIKGETERVKEIKDSWREK